MPFAPAGIAILTSFTPVGTGRVSSPPGGRFTVPCTRNVQVARSADRHAVEGERCDEGRTCTEAPFQETPSALPGALSGVGIWLLHEDASPSKFTRSP